MVVRLVSERELAQTYDSETGWETVEQYREATQLHETQPELARAEIARRVNRSPSAIRGWLVEEKTPHVVKGIQTARERGWIDIESASERFRAFNGLVSWILSGGGLRKDAFVPLFSVDDQLALATLDRLLRWIELPYRVRDADDRSQHLEVIPSEAASVFGRVLHLLGAPLGIKATQNKLTLPDYLTRVNEDHQRDFLRIYILNRGGDLDFENTAGTYLQGPQSALYRQELQELFEEATSGTATLGSQNRIWVSAESVRGLAGDEPLRSALATEAAFGSLTPPTERAFSTTYRQNQIPSGYRYLQIYRQVVESDGSRAKVSNQWPEISETTIRSWRRGSKPYVHNALKTANELGWITPDPRSDTSLALTSLLSWVFARGFIRETYYPVFQLESPENRAHFDTIAENLNLPYSVVRADSGRPTEIRPAEHGAILGRILYTFGAPLADSNVAYSVPPVYLYHHAAHARRFVNTWCKHHASGDTKLTIIVPARLGSRFPDALEFLLTEQLSWPTDRIDDREFVVRQDRI